MTWQLSRQALPVVLVVILISLTAWAGAAENHLSKMEGLLQAQLAAKMRYSKDQTSTGLSRMAENRMGVDTSHPDRQRVYLHFRNYPMSSQLTDLKDLGTVVYEESWIPPLENHPTGFMIVDLPVSKAFEVAKLDFVTRMNSAEKLRQPFNDQATAGARCDSMWAQGLDGSGVIISILDSGLDSTHADIPTLVGGKDYHMAPDSLDDTLEGAHPHGTHVTGSALGRGTLSSGTYRGSAPGADLVFLKIGGDATSSATETAMIAAYIASVDTYGVDIISVSYGGLNTYNDGSEEPCQTIDWAVSQGVLFLTSAGNDANDDMHYSGSVGSSNSDTVEIQVDDNTIIPVLMTWYDGLGVNTDLELQFLDAMYIPVADTSYTQTESDRGTESQYFESDPVSSGTYYLVVTDNSPKGKNGQDYHLYSDDSDVWFPTGADPFYTVIGDACADEAISVGAWVSKGDWPSWTDWCGNDWWYGYTQDDIALFSSRGPRIDGAGPQLPFISAGGSALASCMDGNFSYSDWQIIDNDGLNLDCSGPADYIIMQGTSMACPIAAGVCALLLEHNPDLTPAQVKQIITDNARSDGFTGAVPNDTWGYGKIDAFIDLTAPAQIADLNITAVSDSSVFLSWTAPGDDGASGTATEYDIRYATTLPTKADTGAWWDDGTPVSGEATPQAGGSAESMEVTGLASGLTYFFAIKARDEVHNWSEISDIVGSMTLASPQVSVTYPNGGETLSDSVTITWSATDPNPGETALLLVDLEYSDNGGGSWNPIASGEFNDGSFDWDVSGLNDGPNYLVRATATDPTMRSDTDTSDAVFTIDNPEPPEAIADLTATLASSAIHLSWSAVTEDTSGAPIIVEYYTIFRNADPNFSPGPGDSLVSTVLTYYNDFTPALKDTIINHYYVVRAVDDIGRQSDDSNRAGEYDVRLITLP